MTADIQRQIAAAKANTAPPVAPPPAPKGKTQPAAPKPATSEKSEPAEKHVQLPPGPAVVGPWAIGHWTARRSVAYEPDARVMLTGPAEEFDRLLAHIQAFTP